ncbi:MAG TPA: hypothetical protein DDZ56_02970 [Cytophagales bacterium]|nr:hypothetical protein [Cytophagales bacterium]
MVFFIFVFLLVAATYKHLRRQVHFSCTKGACPFLFRVRFILRALSASVVFLILGILTGRCDQNHPGAKYISRRFR